MLVAYTNHALDQVLEGLVGNGITDIVRIGGRSKSKVLEPYNIKTLAASRMASMSSGFKRRAAILYEKRSLLAAEAEALAAKVNATGQSASWWLLSDYLRVNEKKVFKELNCEHHCGAKGDFQVVGKKGKAITPFYLWDLWKKGSTPPEVAAAGSARAARATSTTEFERGLDLWNKGSKPTQEHPSDRVLFANAHRSDSIWKWSKQQRMDKIEEWLDRITANDRVSLAELLADLDAVDEELRTLHKEPMYEILQARSVRIIGVTSTGASLNADMLAAVRPGVVVGEEAGELLEAHLLAGTHKHVKHMVLIGDHAQLRPKIENYQLR